ncbi:MAG: flagellar filament capping protein FliD [Colwellia sp.]
MPDLTFTGIGSGLEISTIVEAIVGAETAPYTSRANKQQASITTDISAIGALKSALESLSDSIADLADVDNYQLRTARGADSFVSLTSSQDAQVGNYSVKVDALAQAHKIMSGAIDESEAVGEGTLNIAVNGEDFDISVSATDTLSDIRDAINESVDNDSVIATIVTDDDGQHLIMTSKETGLANTITTTVTDVSDGNDIDNLGLSRLAYDVSDVNPLNHITNLSEVTEALDAQITIDGTLVVTNSTNEFENVIDGVDITAKKMHDVDDDISQISFSENNTNIESGLEAFIKSYNELKELSDQLGASSSEGGGALAGDSLLRGVMNKLRQEFSESFDTGNGNSLSLSQIGIESDQYGVLSLDSEILNEYIDSDVDALQQFFVGSDTEEGFATSLTTLIEFYTDDTDGIIQNRIDSREDQLDRLDDDYLVFERRMESLEARLYAQYNAMDLIVANLNSTSTYLLAQLDNMPGVVKQND